MIETLNKLQSHFILSNSDKENMDTYFPLIKSTVVPLAFTGVNARTFHAWKENGLIDLTILKKESENGRKWIRLNLYEFVWVKMIQIMRDFGLPYEIIKIIKHQLELKIYLIITEEIEVIKETWRKDMGFDEEKIAELNLLMFELAAMYSNHYDEDDPYEQQKTMLFFIIIHTIMSQAKSSILVIKNGNEFIVEIVYYDKIEALQQNNYKVIRKPHFEIPLLEIIEEFFNESKSEDYANLLGLYNHQEKKVLNAVRKNDFLELHIKLDKNNDLIIDSINDGNITDEQARQVRKILGMSNYEEITLKYRNDKNLYFKNKTRIS